jgi:small GTP-binding protein
MTAEELDEWAAAKDPDSPRRGHRRGPVSISGVHQEWLHHSATRIELRDAGKDTENPVFEDESHGPGRGARRRPGLSDRRRRWSDDPTCAIVTEHVGVFRLTRCWMLRRFLTDEQEQVLLAERHQLAGLFQPLVSLDAQQEDLATLERALVQLDELFLLVVVGEFNSGKSAFINALLGQRVLVEGVTPTTTQIHILRYGEDRGEVHLEADLAVLTCPIEWLRDINIVDTPGTNAIIQRHQQITEDFVPRADLVLFVTSADRPFSESERSFLQRIREWGKKVVVVVNKIDILETPADIEGVAGFVESNSRELLGRLPMVFPVSARQARQAKETSDADERTRLWAASRFEPLEQYILQTLDERERLKLKLLSPLRVAQRLTERYLEAAQARRATLRDDVSTVGAIEADLGMYETEMRRDFKYHLSHIENVLYAMSERGNRFFDDTIRLTRVFDLVNTERVRGMFEREVVADTSAQVEAQVRDLIDWLVDKDFHQWRQVMDYLNKRVTQQHENRMVGQVGGGFESNRKALLESVGRAAREVVATYNKDAEAKALAESVQMAVAQTALVEVGAIGLGALLVKLLAATMADVSGVLAAGAVAALGFYVIPYKRRRAKSDLQAKISDLRERLSRAMTDQFEKELARSLASIRDAVRPYTRFVEAQQATLADTETALQSADAGLRRLAARIETL